MLALIQHDVRFLSVQQPDERELLFLSEHHLNVDHPYYGKLRALICQFPKLVSQLKPYLMAQTMHPKYRQAYWYVVSYIYQKDDYLPVYRYGFWGYLDDAYLALITCKVIQGQLPHPVHSDLMPSIDQWIGMVRDVVPHTTQQLDGLLARLLNEPLGFENLCLEGGQSPIHA